MISIKTRKTTEMILKRFGEELFDSHVAYVDAAYSMQNTISPNSFRFHKRIFRRVLYACVLIIILLAMTVTVCGALGINLFDFHFDQRPGHAFLIKDNDDNGRTFFRPDYIAKGYHFDKIEDLDVGTRIYAYVNEDGQRYSIQEEQDPSTTIDINTEDNDVEEMIIGDTEVRLYYWRADSSRSAYFVKENTFCIVHGFISKREIVAIIESMRVDN